MYTGYAPPPFPERGARIADWPPNRNQPPEHAGYVQPACRTLIPCRTLIREISRFMCPACQCLPVVPKEWLEGDRRRGALIGSPGTFDSVTTYCNMEGPVGFVPNLLEAPRGKSGLYHWPLPPYALSPMETHRTVLEATAGLWCLRPPTYRRGDRVIRTQLEQPIEDSPDCRRNWCTMGQYSTRMDGVMGPSSRGADGPGTRPRT